VLDPKADKHRLRGARFMSFGPFGPLGALGARMGQGHPLDGFDPEAFQNGAYGDAEAAAESGHAQPRDRDPH
jgi:hypothetical protein